MDKHNVWAAEITIARANAACLFADAKASALRAKRCRNPRSRRDHLESAEFDLDRALAFRAEANRLEGV
jgi:hypothetical protein